jgi:hypothetical protein
MPAAGLCLRNSPRIRADRIQSNEKDYQGSEKDFKRLCSCCDIRVVEPLIVALGSPHTWEAASEALGKLGDAKAVEPLNDALKANSRIYRHDWIQPANALGQIGDIRAVEPLIESLNKGRTIARRAAALALVAIARKHPESLKRIQEVKQIIGRPHQDSWRPTGQSSDCSSVHTDEGISVSFPF